jgi:hypothetical protein
MRLARAFALENRRGIAMVKSPTIWVCMAAFLLPAAMSLPAHTQPAQASSSDVDADALAALDRMGVALRSHKTFVVRSDVTNEEVLDDGQKLQYGGTVQIQAQRPDRFRISIMSDTKNRELYYDGKSLTLFSPRLGLYASFPAPPTIAQTIDKASKEFDIEFPLADLFTWGQDQTLKARIKSAFLVRSEHVGSLVCNHYAFRQERVDWQIWIAQDSSALPCKLVITDKTDPSMPQYTAVMHWSFPNTIAENAFSFAPPAGSHKIAIARADEVSTGGSKQ